MEKLKARDLVQKSTQELKVIEEQCRAELFAVRFQQAIGSLEKSHRIPALRCQIARILTVLSQRAHAGQRVNYQLKGAILQQEYKQAAEQLESETTAFQKKAEAKLAEQQAAATGFDPAMIDKIAALDPDAAAVTSAAATSEALIAAPPVPPIPQDDQQQSQKLDNKEDQHE